MILSGYDGAAAAAAPLSADANLAPDRPPPDQIANCGAMSRVDFLADSRDRGAAVGGRSQVLRTLLAARLTAELRSHPYKPLKFHDHEANAP